MTGTRALLLWALCLQVGVPSMSDGSGVRFPAIEGKSLTGATFKIPESFDRQYSLVIVAFVREQQTAVDTWLPRLKRMEKASQEFRFYEFPVLGQMNSVARWWIYHGMRTGIRSEEARARTVAFHLDKKRFRQDVDIKTEDIIQIFLLDRGGNILWRESGDWSPDKEDALRRVIIGSEPEADGSRLTD